MSWSNRSITHNRQGYSRGSGDTAQPLGDLSLAIAVTVFTNVCNRINDTAIDCPAVASTAAHGWARSGKA